MSRLKEMAKSTKKAFGGDGPSIKERLTGWLSGDDKEEEKPKPKPKPKKKRKIRRSKRGAAISKSFKER